MGLPNHQRRQDAPFDWRENPAKDGPIGRELPQANWCKNADLPGDPSFPPPIMASDYGGPGFLLAPVETLIVRDQSGIEEELQTWYNLGAGVDVVNGRTYTVTDWANRLANDWFGRNYEELSDYDRRRSIRCAMIRASSKAWQIMYIASISDIVKLSQVGSTAGGIAATVLGVICAATSFAPICIAAAVTGGVVGVIAIVTKDQLESINASIERGNAVSEPQIVTVCRTIRTILDTGDAVWDSARGALVSAVNDPEVTAQLTQINNTISAITSSTGEALQAICATLGGLDIETIEDESSSVPPFVPPAPLSEFQIEQRSSVCRTVARAAGEESPETWYWSTVANSCQPGTIETVNGNGTNGNGNGTNGNGTPGFFEQKVGGVPLWAALGIGWVLFSGGYVGGRRTRRPAPALERG